MRVLIVIPSLGSGGGAERSVIESLPGLADRGVEVTVAQLFRRNYVDGAELERLAVPIHELSGSRPASLRALRRLIRVSSPHVVHTMLFEADTIGRLAARRVTSPAPKVLTSLVNTPYDAARLADPNVTRWKLNAVRMADGWTARHLSDHFHAITHAVKKHAVDVLALPPERVSVIGRGRDETRLGTWSPSRRCRSRRALAIDDDALVVVTAGRNEYQKGQAYLIRAFEEVADEFVQALLLVAGREGSATPGLRALVRGSRHGSRIRMLGHRHDLPDIIAAADIFAFPSLYEGQGGVLLEAMALSLPIVTSDLLAVGEVVAPGASALLVSPGDVAGLASALRKLLADRDLRIRLGRHGREIFEARFTLEPYVSGMATLYRQLAAPTTAAPQPATSSSDDSRS